MATLQKMKTKNIYRAANCTFDADTISARSYSHWEFVRVIKGKVVFNDYKYSVTTSKHQWRTKQTMAELGIKIDVIANVRNTLGSFDTLQELQAATLKTLADIAADRADQHAKRLLSAKIARLNAAGLYSAEQNEELKRSVGSYQRKKALASSARYEAGRLLRVQS